MSSSLLSLCAIAVICSFSTHLIFHRHEPSALQFIAFVVTLWICITALCVFVLEHQLIRSAAWATTFLVSYSTGLSFSVSAYRVSPWHPLARFPGPSLARVTKLWSIYHLVRGDRHIMLEKLHHYYGPWIRVGPNELSVNSVAALQPVYHNLQRADSYKGIPTPGDGDTLFTLTDRKVHKERRKAWNKAITGASFSEFAGAANIRFLQLSTIVRGRQGQSAIDLHAWFSLTLMDLIGDIGFSGGFENLASGKDVHGWMTMLETGAVAVSVLGQIPWVKDLVTLIPQKGPIESFHAFSKQKIETALQRQEKDGVKEDILSRIIMDHQDRGAPLTINESAADASLLIASSLETTSQALTTIFRYLVSDPEALARLQQEVDDVVFDLQELDSSVLDEMAYLEAVVNEGLRIRPPAPAGPPRKTGPEGAIILDQYVPKNTTIYVPTWTLQRDPDNFKDPDRFIPERWLRASAKGRDISPHTPQAWVPFSIGHGACVGRQLALQNIKLAIVHILHSFSVKIPENFSLEAFDASYSEHGLWMHDPFLVLLVPRIKA
ncbi:cytochrome P450 [Coprinopsis sp. MPI-PUGE-AT-0042]|nr:cytochrome P450 [Coprinopsis sp. MPI-PUGE-AT-0042]